MPSFNLPKYFSKTPPSHWDVLSFLEQVFKRKGDDYNHSRATNSWTSSLRHLGDSEDQDISSCAQKKLDKYYNEHPSDRIVAKNWYGKEKRRKAKASARAKETQKAATKITYHGPVNNGAVYDSNLALNCAPGNPLSISSSSRGVGGLGVCADVRRGNVVAGEPSVLTAEPPSDDAENTEEEDEKRELREACDGLRQVHSKMVDKLVFSDGRSLEDTVYDYAMNLSELSPAHFCVVDSKMVSTLDDDDRLQVLGRVSSLPAFPENLDRSLSRYDGVTTTAQCRTIAQKSQDDRDVYWIDDVLRHVVELITDSGDILSYDGLNEGVWDCLVYPPFWDRYLISIPDLLLQRKEIPLLASQYEPYPYLQYSPRFDGVVQSRTSRRDRNTRFELAVFEVSSKFDGTESKKWSKDRKKLLAGCRAMLYHLQALVNYDRETMGKLRVAGVLQGGRWTQVFIMSCLNRNVFYLRQGHVREFPITLEELPLVYDIVGNVWKVKTVIDDTAKAVKSYLERRESEREKEREQAEKQCRTDPDFL